MAFLIDSARPARSWRRPIVLRKDTSEITARGWKKPPIRFFATGWFTASFPPMPASTWPISVVGTFTYGTPRMYELATQPPMSMTTPPPKFTITSRRPTCVPVSQSSSSNACFNVLCRSPAGTVATSGSIPDFLRARMITGPYSSATVSSVITATCASRTSCSSCSTVCSNERVTTIGYDSWRSARPSTGVPGAGSSMASTVWTRSRLRSSAGIARSVEPTPPFGDRAID